MCCTQKREQNKKCPGTPKREESKFGREYQLSSERHVNEFFHTGNARKIHVIILSSVPFKIGALLLRSRRNPLATVLYCTTIIITEVIFCAQKNCRAQLFGD
jgi:hypothetical protein